MVKQYQATTGFPWIYAIADRPTIEQFRVVRTDTKFVVDRTGVIAYQGSWGAQDEATWRRLLAQITA